mmetsp:Transcript_15896/g.30468  ORF Transcript_15896/g.30468 Transcript_15896/m.30468 type:complete len:223 (+) Transcript_15896:460-1128(+)
MGIVKISAISERRGLGRRMPSWERRPCTAATRAPLLEDTNSSMRTTTTLSWPKRRRAHSTACLLTEPHTLTASGPSAGAAMSLANMSTESRLKEVAVARSRPSRTTNTTLCVPGAWYAARAIVGKWSMRLECFSPMNCTHWACHLLPTASLPEKRAAASSSMESRLRTRLCARCDGGGTYPPGSWQLAALKWALRSTSAMSAASSSNNRSCFLSLWPTSLSE